MSLRYEGRCQTNLVNGWVSNACRLLEPSMTFQLRRSAVSDVPQLSNYIESKVKRSLLLHVLPIVLNISQRCTVPGQTWWNKYRHIQPSFLWHCVNWTLAPAWTSSPNPNPNPNPSISDEANENSTEHVALLIVLYEVAVDPILDWGRG